MSKLALNGGIPVRKAPISLWPVFDEKERKYLLDVLESREWGKLSGNVNKKFEESFAKFQDANYAVTVCNGTVALRIALFAAGVGPGDEVIIPSYTFVATATAVLESNAVPVFADIDDTLNISPAAIEKVITDRTKAIMPVHFAGAPCDMDSILHIAKVYNLKIIEDAAQAQGSEYNGVRVGALGDAGTFSFQSSKNMTSGEGGIVITNKKSVAEKIWSYHNCGRKPDNAWYMHFNMGGNLRLSEFQAAILQAQLEREEENLALRSKNAQLLNQLLSGIDGVQPVTYGEGIKSSYYLYAVKYNKEYFSGVSKKKFVKALNAEGITTMEGYPFPLYRQPLFTEKNFWLKGCPAECSHYTKEVDYQRLNHPSAEAACQNVFWLPNLTLHGSEEDTNSIAEAMCKIKKNIAELTGDNQ